MANWLDKALGRGQPATPVAVVPFEIRCDCGAPLTGVRAQRFKRAICAQCGEAHFILPVNQYAESERTYFAADPPPEPSPLTEPESRDPLSTDLYRISHPYVDRGPDAASAIEPACGNDDTADIAGPSPQKSCRQDSHRTIRPARAAGSSRPRPTGMIEAATAGRRWGATSRRVAAAATGFLLLVLATALWTVRNQAIDQAELQLTAATDAGKESLAGGDFLEARQHLQKALEALDTIGAGDEQIAPIRRLWLEAHVATNLVDASIEDMIDAARDARKLDPADWQDQFDVRYGGRWLLIDISPVETVQVQRVDDPDEPPIAETRLVYPWTVDGFPIHFAGLQNLLSPGRARLVVAGRLLSATFDDDSQAWVIRMDPAESFLWTQFDILLHLGFTREGDEPLRQLLNQQRSRSGSSRKTAEAGPDADRQDVPQDRSDADSGGAR